MKIILTAFGNMKSNLMDVPENTSARWDMVLMQPLQAFTGYNGEKLGEKKPFETRCTFEWTGKMYTWDDEMGRMQSARQYVLTDIQKL